MSEMLATTPERKLWNDGPNYTADAIIIDRDAEKILLIKRGDSGEWAIPGGFVDASDSSSFESAKREAMEEANIALSGYAELPFYHGIVDDPRNSEDAWIETSAYLFDASSETESCAGDDAVDAQWFSLHELPRLYASHAQIVARALDQIMSHDAHQKFLDLDGDHYVNNVDGGHMGYDKYLHTRSESSVSIFQKSFDISFAHDHEHAAHSRMYLQKEAKVMSHLRTQGYNHLPAHSELVSNVTLFMEGYNPENGWHWRAPIESTEQYINDCLEAFEQLEEQPIFPDTDEVLAPLESFHSEGWVEIDDEKYSALRNTAEKLSPHFQASTRESLEKLLADIPALRSAAQQMPAPERYVLAHHDARQSNIAWHPDEGARLVDWSWYGYGRPNSDATSFMIDMHKSGHDISAHLDKISPEHCLTLIGFWLEHSTRDPRGDTTVRRQQLLSAISGYEVLTKISR